MEIGPAHSLHEIGDAVATWFERGHRQLPWRKTRDPYAIWVSEIMLQQTRVQTVVPYYERWLARFPTVESLAQAPLDDVLALWSGLGYYSRARALHRAANTITERFSGRFPRRAQELRTLDGIGPYTAGAIASTAFGEPVAAVDGNCERVLCRMFLLQDRKQAWDAARALLPPKRPASFNQGLIELGATLCKPTPHCVACPVQNHCRAARENLVEAYPPAKPKRVVPTIRLTTIVLARGDRWLLRKRPDIGLWAGLWEFPTEPAKKMESIRAAAVRLLGTSGLDATLEAKPALRFDHELTHRRMRFSVFYGRCGHANRVDGEWISPAEVFARAISAATRRILDHFAMTHMAAASPTRSHGAHRVLSE